MRIFKRLSEMHAANKVALETNKVVLQNAEQEAETIKVIQALSASQERRLRAANTKNHYSESLTRSMQGRTT